MPRLPLAAGLDWLEAVLPLLFIGFWVLSQLFAIGKKVAGPPADAGRGGRPAPPVQQPARPPRRPDAAPGPASAGDLQDEIRDFLRRTSSPEPRSVEVRRPPPPRPKPVERKPLPAAPQPAAGQPFSSIAEHVKADFAKELEHLSSPLTTDSPAGGALATAPVAGRAAATGDIATMLRSPATLRQLFVVREVLERPVDRW